MVIDWKNIRLSCCVYMKYSYEAAEPTKTISLEVTWNGGHYIDDNYGITGRSMLLCSSSSLPFNWQLYKYTPADTAATGI